MNMIITAVLMMTLTAELMVTAKHDFLLASVSYTYMDTTVERVDFRVGVASRRIDEGL